MQAGDSPLSVVAAPSGAAESAAPRAPATSDGGVRSGPGPSSSLIGALQDHLFPAAFVASAVTLGAFLIVPMLQLFGRGYIFGADWSEYLYSGPLYLSGTSALLHTPIPCFRWRIFRSR